MAIYPLRRVRSRYKSGVFWSFSRSCCVWYGATADAASAGVVLK